ncbi:hypothetical protein ACHWQZ_G017960 [Mnemiopsis leidyi]
MAHVMLEAIRSKVEKETQKHQYGNALFWADKAVSLGGGDPKDIFTFVNILYLRGEYRRAVYFIQTNRLQISFYGAYLIAKCQAARGDWNEAKETLELLPEPSPLAPPPISADGVMTEQELMSSVYLLKGTVYQALDNHQFAAQCFKLALKEDPYCVEAYENLVYNHYYTGKCEGEIISDTIDNSEDLTTEEAELIRFLYAGMSKKYHNQQKQIVPNSLTCFNNNVTVLTSQAERLYYNCRFNSSYETCLRALKIDPYHFPTLLVHIGCLYELGKKNDLFILGHKLVELYPKAYISWYAVGIYYSLIKKWESARQCLSKSTSLNKLFAAGWLAYGHAFAAEGENDQALATYFTASRLLKGCHLPLLYIGLQYGSTNNPLLAEKFFKEAISLAPNDPFVLAEMGALYTQTGKWEYALSYLQQALSKVKEGEHEWAATTWSPLYINLGQVYRIAKQYDQAIKCFKHAQFLACDSSTVYTGLGFVYALQGNAILAVEYCHKALDKERQDPFTIQLLEMSLTALAGSGDKSDEEEIEQEEREEIKCTPTAF